MMVEAARQSKELEVSTDGHMVRRTRELPTKDDSEPRTVYIEGLQTSTTIEQVQDLMEKFGSVRAAFLAFFFACRAKDWLCGMRALPLSALLCLCRRFSSKIV